MNFWLWCYVIWQVNAVVFTGIWLLQKKTKNAGIVDLAWTFGTGIAGMILVGQASGPAVRKWIVGGIVLAWTLRLGIYLGVRIFSEEEDGRYADMRKKWGDAFEKRIFLVELVNNNIPCFQLCSHNAVRCTININTKLVFQFNKVVSIA